MRVRELCRATVVTASGEDTLVGAARLMREHHVGSIVIVEERQGLRVPVGILTDRDIVVGVVAQAPTDLQRLRVSDVVIGQLVTAREDESVDEVVRRMRGHGIRRVPVVDSRGGLVGVLAADDLIRVAGDMLGELSRLIETEQAKEERRRP
jgi:CBS domain-containing protein